MFGLTVNPLCAIVIPVVRFAIGPINDETKKIKTAIAKTSVKMDEVLEIPRVFSMLRRAGAKTEL